MFAHVFYSAKEDPGTFIDRIGADNFPSITKIDYQSSSFSVFLDGYEHASSRTCKSSSLPCSRENSLSTPLGAFFALGLRSNSPVKVTGSPYTNPQTGRFSYPDVLGSLMITDVPIVIRTNNEGFVESQLEIEFDRGMGIAGHLKLSKVNTYRGGIPVQENIDCDLSSGAGFAVCMSTSRAKFLAENNSEPSGDALEEIRKNCSFYTQNGRVESCGLDICSIHYPSCKIDYAVPSVKSL